MREEGEIFWFDFGGTPPPLILRKIFERLGLAGCLKRKVLILLRRAGKVFILKSLMMDFARISSVAPALHFIRLVKVERQFPVGSF